MERRRDSFFAKEMGLTGDTNSERENNAKKESFINTNPGPEQKKIPSSKDRKDHSLPDTMAGNGSLVEMENCSGSLGLPKKTGPSPTGLKEDLDTLLTDSLDKAHVLRLL